MCWVPVIFGGLKVLDATVRPKRSSAAAMLPLRRVGDGEDMASAGSQDPEQLAMGGVRIRYMLEDIAGDHEVERLVVKAQVLNILVTHSSH